MPTSSTNRTYRFGAFEVDFAAGELRKSGVRVRVQDQPLHILAALLEHPGKVVTREELRNRLWTKDTFVDFDHGLNSAVKKLRSALNDDALVPRFIETVPRRGYRFVGALIELKGISDDDGSQGKCQDAIGSRSDHGLPNIAALLRQASFALGAVVTLLLIALIGLVFAIGTSIHGR